MLKILLFLAAPLPLAGVVFFVWFQQEPQTQLVDASGQALTAGAPSPDAEARESGDLFDEAKALMEAKRFAEAKEALVAIMERSDRDGEACVLLSDVLRNLKDGDGAEDYGLKAIQLLPDSAEAHRVYARALGYKLAKEIGSFTGILGSFKRVGQFKEAAKRAIELDPDDTEARTMLVFYNMAPRPIGNIDEAVSLCEEIAARDPVLGKRLLAFCLQRKGETDQAVALCKRAIEEYPDRCTGFHLTLADIYSDGKRFEEADQEYEAARQGEKDETYFRSLYYQALMRIRNEFDAQRAVVLLEEYIASEPEGDDMPSVAYACLRKGNALKMLGRIDEARAAFNESLRREPGFEPAQEALEELPP